MPVRGIRGAITAKSNSKGQIVTATKKLLLKMLSDNRIKAQDIASAFFTVTKDLSAEFPAVAARHIGLTYTPLLCSYEINVPGSVKKCIRILLHVNTGRSQRSIKNIYLGKAEKLRPDMNSHAKKKRRK